MREALLSAGVAMVRTPYPTPKVVSCGLLEPLETILGSGLTRIFKHDMLTSELAGRFD